MSVDRSIIDYLPPVLRDVPEFKILMVAEQPELDALWLAQDNALDDQFVTSATENGVQRWESILNITPKATITLDERKFTILTRLAEQLPYTITMLKSMLSTMCGPDGYKLTLDAEAYTLTVLIALTAVNNFNDVCLMLRRVCPANLVIALSVIFNQHFKLQQFTNAQLGLKTHYQLRNEVLNAWI